MKIIQNNIFACIRATKDNDKSITKLKGNKIRQIVLENSAKKARKYLSL